MKKFTIEAYGITVRAYQYHLEEEIKLVGAEPGAVEMKQILADSEFCFNEKRTTGSLYGLGYSNDDIHHIILANGIDEKQLSNLFLSVGATEAYVSYEDITSMDVTSLAQEKEMLEHKINPADVTGEQLGLNTTIVAGTISAADLEEKPKPKAKKKRK